MLIGNCGCHRSTRTFGACFAAGIECQMQGSQSAQSQIGSPNERLGTQFPIFSPGHQVRKHDLALNSRKRSTEAEVRGPSERQMMVVLSTDVKTIRIREALRITVSCSHDGNGGLRLPNLLPT